MAAEDVANAVARVAVGSPLNGVLEMAGPESSVSKTHPPGPHALKDPREVIAHLHARYFGTELSERSLVPDDDAQLGETISRTGLTNPQVRSRQRTRSPKAWQLLPK